MSPVKKSELRKIKNLVKDITKPRKALTVLRKFFDGETKRSKISSGGYAKVVLPADRDFVIKVIKKNDNPSYSEYAKFSMHNYKKYENLPQVYHIFSTDHLEFFVLEKLYHKSNLRFEKKYIEYDSAGKVFASKHNPLYPILRKIQSIALEHNSDNDIGYNNLMVRHDGTVVITDPLAD